MKTQLKLRTLMGLLLLSVAFTACKKSANTSNIPEKTGVINLDVLYTCNGCPGSAYDIRFVNDSTIYHISNDLTPFGITTSSKFPINVTVSTTSKNEPNANFLNVTALTMNK